MAHGADSERDMKKRRDKSPRALRGSAELFSGDLRKSVGSASVDRAPSQK